MVNIEVTIPDLPDFIGDMVGAEASVRQELVTGVNRTALQGEALAKRGAPVRTGQLRRSIAATPASASAGGVTATYGTATPYAPYVEYGRGPVVAGPGKVLRFEVGGRVLYRKRVGPARPRPFIGPTVMQVRSILTREVDAAVIRILARLGAL